ncbi:hypothetical protein N7462_003054 [Penicillium macrosclerotiorum]|uniref:uncharacterized protein n=1 Tax=Penicillium macrosclerotiorum TaxID=303699 RepID=UPI0025491454|nr:uncharacterized protein N7462_003054 [Penicillium macrosclerotiorum]KAJ5688662.1 hypothetical protein N7462_003054 [Penicillium macrosclerotiorum]
MGRSRVLSFISTWGGPKNNESGRESKRSSKNVTPAETPPRWQTPSPDTPSPPSELSPTGGSTSRGEGIGSRPASMIFSRNPPLITHAEDTPPELSPIFTYLNIHTNKVYQEGYFLKLNDQDTHGRPCSDRQWVECYAQLVGTVLSLWEATALDAAGGEEVPATFINLADASLKMIETLPIRNGAVQPLKNVLSLSSAGKNRYLLHFSSFHSMIQWTAAIRLAMYEHTSLYEAYTGSLIAAKGKTLNGIQSILVPTKFKYEDWARVRFGAGTPWRRCWFVINPPDEKEIQKARKVMKKSAYDRLSIPITGTIKFYETKKTKKVQPIATVTHVYSAYAIYPQSKALIDQSTLVKLEGQITMHSGPSSSSEGLVFVMPELHAAVSGFEMMLRFLFPTFDTFNLYGRPTRLVADTNHIKSIMFAFPKERRYGYLDVLDIVNLLQTQGSQEWSEAEWRKQLKEATQKRNATGRRRGDSVTSRRPRYRTSVISTRNGEAPIDLARRQFAPEAKPEFNQSADAIVPEAPRDDSMAYHSRGMSDITDLQRGARPAHGSMLKGSPDSSTQDLVHHDRVQALAGPVDERTSSDSDRNTEELARPPVFGEQLPPRTPPSPVVSPPAFAHGPRELPFNRPAATDEQRRANNRMSHATLTQLTQVGKMGMGGAAFAYHDQQPQRESNSDQQLQDHSSNTTFSPRPIAPVNSQLMHRSSEEQMGHMFPIRQPPTSEPRPLTPNSAGKPSPKPDLAIGTVQSLKRKPLPQRQLFEESPQSPGEPSLDDLRHTLDEDALNRIAPHLPSPVSPTRNDAESVYDDASTVSPDYASTHESIHSKKSVQSTARPRMGVMKIVGEPVKQDLVIGDARYSTIKPEEPNPDIPAVDFGPTLTYMPTTGRPSTGDTLRKASHQRNDSEAAERLRFNVPTNTMEHGHNQSPSQDEFRRSVLWQPGMTGRPTTPGGGLTPEQFVQQRAAPTPPVHMHHRSPSGTAPSPQRPGSADWQQHVRPNSRMTSYQDPYQRPSSRGTTAALANYNERSNHLSAREQEHVARITGSSFFNMSNSNRQPQPQVNPMGLVSTIDARERERREMKEGMSNQMVQHAIAQRQQAMMHQPHQAGSQYAGSMMHQQPQPGTQYAGSMYPPPSRQDGMYNLPGASQTWDALHQMNRPDEPRRRSWYGQLAQQAPPTPPSYQQSQQFAHQGGYHTNYNTTQS